MKFHRKLTIPTGPDLNPGDVYHVPVEGSESRVNEYKIDSNGAPRFVEGITLDQSLRIEQLTQAQITKLAGLKTQAQIDADIANGVSSLIPVTTLALPRGGAIPSYITTKGKATLRGNSTAPTIYTNTGTTPTTITVPIGSETDAFYDKPTDSWTAGQSQLLPKGADGKTIERFNDTKVSGYVIGDNVFFGEDLIYSAIANAATGESPLTAPSKWRLELDTTKFATKQALASEISITREDSGVQFFADLERGSYTATTGAPVDYTTAQPRMRSKDFIRVNGTVRIKSTKEFFVILFDPTKKYISNTSGTYVTELTLVEEYKYFKIVARNVGSTLISDSDLVNTITIEKLSEDLTTLRRLESLKASLSIKDYSLVWQPGTIEVTANVLKEVAETPIVNSLYSSFFKSTEKNIAVSVGADYLIGACIYTYPDYSLPAKLYYFPATTNTLNLSFDDTVYVAFFVKRVDSTPLPSIVPTAFTYLGITPLFKGFQSLPKAKLVKVIPKGVEQGQWTDNRSKLASATRIRWISEYAGTKNAYYKFQINPIYNFDVLVFKGSSPTLKYKETQRDNFNLMIAKGDNFVINIYRVDRANITPDVVTEFQMIKIDSEENPLETINLNNKIDRDIFNAEDYGIHPDNFSNSAALNSLIDYLNNHGGGTIKFGRGIYSFDARVWVRSGINIIGCNRHHTIFRMFGDTNYSLFDNGVRAVYNAKFQSFTIDGYDHNPPVYSTDGKGFNFHYAIDCEFSDLNLRGTQGTGIGTDFLHGVKIFNNHVVECGRGWTEGGEGGSGIGIGTGGMVQENFIVSNNVVERCGQNGIFIEDQGIWLNLQWPSRGQIICNNVIQNGRKNGLAARGNTFCNFNNNLVYNNVNGFFADLYFRDSKVDNNSFILNQNGINLSSTTDTNRVDFNNNMITRNTSRGILMNANLCKNIVFNGNTITDNNKGVVVTGTSGEDISFMNNLIKKNTGNAIELSGIQKDFIWKFNIIKGAQVNTTSFTGDTTSNDLI